MDRPAGVVVLFGPKGVGKSTIAQLLEQHGGVRHVDPDLIALGLISAGGQPDPATGWLEPVEQAVRESLLHHRWVAVEATGAWESDWALVGHLNAWGARVVRVWVTAPLQVTLSRLALRRTPAVQFSENQTRRIYTAASLRAASEPFDAVIDSAAEDPQLAASRLLRLLTRHGKLPMGDLVVDVETESNSPQLHVQASDEEG